MPGVVDQKILGRAAMRPAGDRGHGQDDDEAGFVSCFTLHPAKTALPGTGKRYGHHFVHNTSRVFHVSVLIGNRYFGSQ